MMAEVNRTGRPTDRDMLVRFAEGMGGRTLAEALGFQLRLFRCMSCRRAAPLKAMRWMDGVGFVHANAFACRWKSAA